MISQRVPLLTTVRERHAEAGTVVGSERLSRYAPASGDATMIEFDDEPAPPVLIVIGAQAGRAENAGSVTVRFAVRFV